MRHSMRREASAIWGAIRMLHGVSIIAQMVMDSGAPLSTMIVASWRIASALSTLANIRSRLRSWQQQQHRRSSRVWPVR